MRNDEKSKRALSVRLPLETMLPYSQVIEGAGITISEDVRTYAQSVVDKSKALDISKMRVEVDFKWRKPDPAYDFPEKIGTLHVSVTPPAGMSAEDLSKLVFITPEFFRDGKEPLQIDSYHQFRVSDKRIAIASTRVNRHILSFRLIGKKWSAGIFDYTRDGADQKAIEEEIRTAVQSHISNTIICSMIGHLPAGRALTQDELEHYEQLSPLHQSADA